MRIIPINPPKKYDFIIVGGGVAGLSLAYQLVNSQLADRSILIIDQKAKDKNDRTLSFWADQATPFDEIVYHTWNNIRFVSEDFAKDINLGNYAYKTIRGIDFYQFVTAKLAAFPNVTFLRRRVDSIEDTQEGAFVNIGEEQYFGNWVFDSRLRPFELKHEPVLGKQVLRQYFKGWLLETQENSFNPDSATLFDFRVPQSGDMRFFYVLPFSERQALIEYVGLEHTDYDSIMQQYVEETLQLKDYAVEPIEGGAIVLTDRRFKRKLGQHVMAIGSAGGMIKPSSGYAFTRILKDATAIVDSLVKHNHPFNVPGLNPFYYFLDSQMLEAMNRFRGNMKAIFTGMFKFNSAQRVFRFLDERTSVWEMVVLVASMPNKHLFVWTTITDQKQKAS